MGFHAPSAEEVYRYAFRLDSQERTLTDRFGFSIVFVNDTSKKCQEFLQNYCIDLCFRTAERIRFIFFSELAEKRFDLVAKGLQNGNLKGGMLRNILAHIGLSHTFGYDSNLNDLDYEHKEWRALRPRSLFPLRNQKDIEQRLGWECDTKTAIPGTYEAMKFAQRLGIGKYIPCVLIFTDVGKLQVNLMPVEHMSPNEIYKHIRNWVDSFYEKNHNLIQRWHGIEEGIEKLCRETNSSLSEIRDWRNRVQNSWDILLFVSKSIQVLEECEQEGFRSIAQSVVKNLSMSYDTRIVFTSYLKQLKDTDKQRDNLSQLVLALNNISESEDYFAIYKSLKEMGYLSRYLTIYPQSVKTALDQLKMQNVLIKGPQDELTFWLSSYARRFPRKLYRKHRNEWRHLIGSNSRSINEEFDAVLAALNQVELSVSADIGSEKAVTAIAKLYSIDINRQDWIKAVSNFREQVKTYIHEILTTLPEWLREKRGTINFPCNLPKSGSSIDVDQFLKDNPAINIALEDVERRRFSKIALIRKEREQIAKHHKSVVQTELHELILNNKVADEEWKLIRGDALSHLRQLKHNAEKEIFREYDLSRRANSPLIPVDRKKMKKFKKSLADYDEVVSKISYPHMEDPAVFNFELGVPISYAIGFEKLPQTKSASERLRNSMRRAEKNETIGEKLWPEVQRDIMNWNSVAKFNNALESIMTNERLELVLKGYQGESLQKQVASILESSKTMQFLRTLKTYELDALIHTLENVDTRNLPNSFYEKANIVLTSIGVFDGREFSSSKGETKQELDQKITNDAFDVFMAHNSSDKQEVAQICKNLKKHGVYPWMDAEQIPPGQWFQDVIQSAIPKVKTAAIFIGQEGLGKWQALELRAFMSQCIERGIPIIPVLLPGVESIPENMLFLRELSWVQFCERLDEREAMMQLIWGITGKQSLTDD